MKHVIIASFQKYVRFVIIFGILVNTLLVNGQQASTGVVSFKVTGIVSDATTNKPIEAAQIVTYNSNSAATTKEDGSFEIDVQTDIDVLVITAFEYNSREIAIKGRSNVDIKLYSKSFTPAYSAIESVVGERKSSFNTQASKQIDELDNLGYATVDEPIQMALGGDVRAISRSGLAGIGSSYFIRGLNSLNANAQPLFVVDGVVWNNYYDVTSLHDGYFINSLVDINVDEIESVTVIKDGTSLYGSKATNGVILINTIRGRGKATKITVSAMGGITQQPSTIPTMDGDQYRIYVTDLLGGSATAEEFGTHPFLDDDPNSVSYLKYHNKTNWHNDIYQQSKTQNVNISVNGGDEKALYNFSVGYYGNTGIVNTSNFNRLNTRFNADFTLTEKFSMQLNMGFSNADRILLDDGVNQYTSPNYLAYIKAPFLNSYQYTNTGTLTTDFEDSDIFEVGNPLAVVTNALNTSKHNRLNIGVKPAYQINDKLSISSLFDYNLDKVKETYYRPIIGAVDREIPGYGVSENMFQSQQMRNIGIYDDTRLSYTNTFNHSHNINAVLGWRYISNFYESDFGEGHNTGTDQKRNLSSELEFKKADGKNDRVKSISNYLNVNYNYLSKYFLTLTASMDGSSRFGTETQGGMQLFGHSWGLFPAVNAAWLVSSEKFMAGINMVDQLKLRASFGVSGNDDIDPYAYATYFVSNRYIDRGNGILIGNVGNSEIQWETSAKMNLGMDMNLFNDHLSLSADVYSNKTSDLLSLRELPKTAGLDYYLGNGGELTNVGYEVSATIRLVDTKPFKWELKASVGHYKNEIVSLPEGDYTTSTHNGEILTAVGNAAGVFYGYKSLGVISNNAQALEADLKMLNKDGSYSYFKAGDMLFDDLDGNNIIDEEDRQIIGDPNPDYYGSILSSMHVGNLKLDAFFTYSSGNDIYNYMRYNLESGSSMNNQSTAMLNRWTHEGQVTDQPQASIGDVMGNSRFSDRWIEDGSYLKLKSLSLSYKVNLESSVISGLTIKLSANNLITFSNYLGLDPEVSPSNQVLLQGIDTGLIPASRSYLIGIKLNL